MARLTVLVFVGLLCVALTDSGNDVAFEIVLQHIELLRAEVKLLQSHGRSTMTSVPRDCADIRAEGKTSSGVYDVYIGNKDEPLPVYCDMTTDGGAWLVFQRRRDGTVDFYRNWAEYRDGFGYPGGEFWLGNEALHWLTAANNNKLYELRIDLADFNNTRRYAKYSEFKIASESLKYKLASLGSFSGTAGDSLSVHRGAEFSTFDRDNDVHSTACAVAYKGGWWYQACHASNLNGLYLGGPHESYADGVEWKTWTGYRYSLKISEMKIRPVGL